MKMGLKRNTGGFSLIEALVAVAILGFGLLAVARLQALLVESSSFSRQRTEATRLAQEKLEQLRAFGQLAISGTMLSYDAIASSAAENITSMVSNTTYSRSASVTTSVEPAFKTIAVTVAWTDLKGANQSVTLNSMIAGLDPKVSGSLVVPPVGSPVKQPRNRALSIPVAATKHSETKSVYTPPGNPGYYLVFDNATGQVTAKCSGAYSLTHSLSGALCSDNIYAYVITGYVRFSTGNTPDAIAPSSNRMATTFGTSRSNYSDVTPADECTSDSSLTTPTHANTVTYTCLIYPKDHDDNTSTPRLWSGRVVLALTSNTIGTASTQFKICRYSYDYDGNGVISNNENPGDYVNVNDNLSNQNYLVIKGDKSCPVYTSDSTKHYSTTQHQP